MSDREHGRVAGILLAAGEGRRIGGPKALLRLGGRLLVERGADCLGGAGCDEVIVVVGAEAQAVTTTADLPGARVVTNPGWPEGIGSSVRVGLERAAELDADAAVITLVDQPDVGAEAIRRVIRTWRGGAVAAVATYHGAPRNPVALDRSVFEAVREAAVGDVGARAYLRVHPDVVTHVACEDVADATDLDTPEDLRARVAGTPPGRSQEGPMQLNHSFTVPVDVDHAWQVLRDIERIGPCMPGATIEDVQEETFTGRVKVKVGPMQVQYRGEARWVDVDEQAHRATIEAKGQETRGSGTASATIRAELVGRDGATEVTVITDLAITGKPAQFGRGVMSDVGEKLLGQFATCLEKELEAPSDEDAAAAADSAEGEAAAEAAAGPAKAAAQPPSPEPAFSRMIHFDRQKGEDRGGEAVDLLGVAGMPLAKRLLPVAGGLLVLWLLVRLVRARRR